MICANDPIIRQFLYFLEVFQLIATGPYDFHTILIFDGNQLVDATPKNSGHRFHWLSNEVFFKIPVQLNLMIFEAFQ